MNPVVHFEIPVKDIAAATQFYEQAFGWQIKTFDMPGGGGYTAVTTAETGELSIPKKPGAINGGMLSDEFKLASTGRPVGSTVITVSVPSIEDAIAKVEAAGGKVLAPKQTIPEMADYAYVSDPDGNVVGLWHDFKWSY